ncbi:hypothetical protein BHU72_14605 [Desulfuribacillus stibiiarsenatis]|uniref:Uncharacterized protein n=2 Tax=Desulfuribacillus stibiiarsenatis TaxID=1390249 RepID=A0A1E5L7E7_9FIRM|nr:hypothetical protein BHU72_14605 [Desulfuribacillus stibiiarsenatis]
MLSDYAQKQREDLNTKANREDIKISLTDKEYSNLKLMAYKAGFRDAGELISSFVGDLTGWQSNGSDERDKANEWYERAFGTSEYHSNIRHYLYDNDYSLDDMNDLLEDEDYFEEIYQAYISENSRMNNESKEQCLQTLKDIVSKGVEL